VNGALPLQQPLSCPEHKRLHRSGLVSESISCCSWKTLKYL